MANDIYSRIANAPVGSTLFDALGLPRPTDLDRYRQGAPLIDGTVLIGAAPGGRLLGRGGEGPGRGRLRGRLDAGAGGS